MVIYTSGLIELTLSIHITIPSFGPVTESRATCFEVDHVSRSRSHDITV